MKIKLGCLISLILLTTTGVKLVAQEKTEPQTLFGGGNSINVKDLGFVISPMIGFTQMDEAATTLFNLRAGLSVKDKITVGGYFSTSLNEIMPKSETLPNIYMDYWSVGGFGEYTLLSNNLLHLTFPLFIGYGEVQMDNEMDDADLGESNFFQIEPSVLLEINLNKFARFNVGAGYRHVGEMSYRNFNQSDISGLTAYVGLKFGLFR